MSINQTTDQANMMEQITRASTIRQTLLDYYGLPQWRNPMPPLDELVSTILSQNTNDTNRDRAYQSLRRRFPTWEQVRDADTQSVVEAIRPAGLANQKGPRIQQVLREISRQNGSLSLDFLANLSVDEGMSWLQRFKGVGPKTASIVMLFSLGKPAFPVDTHIYRVSGRLGLRPARITAEQTHTLLADLFPPESYYDVHLNLIRLGREICQARKLNCPLCPLKNDCELYQRSSTGSGGMESSALAAPKHKHAED